jgi:hypothetical protein
LGVVGGASVGERNVRKKLYAWEKKEEKSVYIEKARHK